MTRPFRFRARAALAALAAPLALAAAGALAQAAPSGPAAAVPAANPASAPGAPSLLPLVLGFIVVLALIPAAAWIMRRSGLAPRGGASGLRIGGQLAVGPRERVVIIEAGDRRWLIGVTPTGITRLGTLPPAEGSPADAGSALPAPAGPAGGAGGFADLLRRMVTKP